MLLCAAAVGLSACSTLTSMTYIDAGKSFVLGEGKHGSYRASVQNTSLGRIEVFQKSTAGDFEPLGVLKFLQKLDCSVPANTEVIFKNTSDGKAALKIKLVGDTGLSMGYKDNNN